MLNILTHKGNVNQNDIKIPSHPNQNDNHQENKQQMQEEWGGRGEGGTVSHC
jgi:hypothetical protein